MRSACLLLLASALAGGCKDEPGPPPAASASASTATAPAAKAYPPPHAPGAIWGPLKLGMRRASAKAALTKLGYDVETLGPRALPDDAVNAKRAPWSIMVSFAEARLNRVLVVGQVDKADAEAATKRLAARLGRGRPIQQARYRTWTSDAGEYELSMMGMHDGAACEKKDCLSWSVTQAWRKKGGAGALGFAGLTWGMSVDAIRDALARLGLDVQVEAGRHEIRSDDERSGRIELEGGKLVALTLSENVPTRKAALARRDALSKERPPQSSISQSRTLRFERDGVRADIRTGDGKEGKRLVSETYEASPKP